MASQLDHELAKLRQGDHLCPVHDSLEEQTASAVAFIAAGLRNRERCLYVANDSPLEDLVRRFAAMGVNVSQEAAKGSLKILTKRDAYLRDGCFDARGMLSYLTECEAAALAFEEEALFAMLPSVSAISRSAIFQGSREVYNLKSPGRAAEAKSFAAFFENKHTKYFTDKDVITSDAILGYDVVSVLYTFYDDLGHSTHFAPLEDNKEPYFDAVWRYLEKSTV